LRRRIESLRIEATRIRGRLDRHFSSPRHRHAPQIEWSNALGRAYL